MKNYEDLRQMAKNRGMLERANISLAELSERILKRTVLKPHDLRLSSWSSQTLSEAQIRYAALDVWAGYRVGIYKIQQDYFMIRFMICS
jgi:ribonuclease D